MRWLEWIKKHCRIILIAVAAATVVFFAVFGIIRFGKKTKTTTVNEAFPVHINEIMTSNGSYPNSDGVCCDYIELYNDSDRRIKLDGYQLGDDKDGERFIVPKNTVIAAHEYLVICCDKERSGAFYARFGLSKHGGEDIFFMDPNSVVVETVRTLAAGKDAAQGRDEAGNWTLLPFGTPGYENTRGGYRKWAEQHKIAFDSDVLINEIMVSNSIYPVADGACTDWIELYNASDTAVALDGYGLTDTDGEAIFVFPEGTTLEAGAYLVIPCSQTEENTARFGLSRSGGENVTLFSADGTAADMVRTVAAEQNQSFARMEDGSWKLTYDATPGYPNTEEGREAYVRSIEPEGAEIHITEIMADNKSICADATGLFHDWVELTNTGSAACSLSGWFLSDDPNDPTQWRIPDCTLEAGASVVIWFAGNRDGEIDGQLFAPISLSAAGESVLLSDPIGGLMEEITFGPMEENRSLVIDPSTGEQTVCAYPTPGFAGTTDGYDAFAGQLTPNGPIAIWEVMTANDAYLSQSGEYYDWLEIKNISSEPVDLSAYSITDDSKHSDRYVLPEVTLQPNELYIVILSGHTEYSNKHYAHANFALNAQEDNLFLFGNGTLVDYAHLYRIPYHYTYGRCDGEGGFFYMTPTPGKDNTGGYRMVSGEPAASVPSGVYNNVTGIDVTLEADGIIYYTTDCSDPDRNATVYTGPIHLDETTILRSVAYEPDKKESEVLTCSYLLNEPHDLPVVSLVTDPWHLWDANKGIYVNSLQRKDIEYPASAAYFGTDGTWETDCGVKMHGLTSLISENKKSFTLKFSGVYDGPLHYDVFGDGEITAFKSVVLRADSESVYASFLRDNLLHKLAKQYSKSVLAQNTRYVVLYLNGEYWGIYSIREQYTPFFYASNMGVPEDTVTLSKNFIRGGTSLAEVQSYVANHNMSNPANYAYVTDRIDVSSLIDWAIFESYCCNYDIEGNLRFLYSSVDAKWRFGIVDVDLGFFSNGCFINVLNAPQLGNIVSMLLKNDDFKQQFLTRLGELLSDGLSDRNVLALIDEMAGEIRSELPNEVARWGGPKNWETMVTALKDYVDGRAKAMITGARKTLRLSDEEIKTYFGDLMQ